MARLTLSVLVAFCIIPLLVSSISITGCMNLDTSGNYELANDINAAGKTNCFNITASNVVLDGQGNQVYGDQELTGGTIGINVSGADNVIIKNLQFGNFYDCVKFHESENGIVNNISLHDCGYSGVYINSGSHNTTVNVSRINDGYVNGVFIENANRPRIIDNNMTDFYPGTTNGVTVRLSEGGVIAGNTIQNVISNGVYLDYSVSEYNITSNNLTLLSTGIYLDDGIWAINASLNNFTFMDTAVYENVMNGNSYFGENIINNTENGFVLYGGIDVLYGNRLTLIDDVAIGLYSSENKVLNNLISENGVGIYASVSYNEIRNNYIGDSDMNAIYVENIASNLLIENNTFNENVGSWILLQDGAEYIVIENNTFNAGFLSVATMIDGVENASPEVVGYKNVLIQNNSFSNTMGTAITLGETRAIERNLSIRNNLFENFSGLPAITLGTLDLDWNSGVYVINATFTNVSAPITIQKMANLTLTTITANALDAVLIDGIGIEIRNSENITAYELAINGYDEGNSPVAVYLNNVTNITIDTSTFEDNYRGITLYGTDDVNIVYTHFKNINWDIYATNGNNIIRGTQNYFEEPLDETITIIDFAISDNAIKAATPASSPPPNYSIFGMQNINVTSTTIGNTPATIFVYYTHFDPLPYEDDLFLARYNGSWNTEPSTFTSDWGVDTTDDYVWATITQFGCDFPMLYPDGEPPEEGKWYTYIGYDDCWIQDGELITRGGECLASPDYETELHFDIVTQVKINGVVHGWSELHSRYTGAPPESEMFASYSFSVWYLLEDPFDGVWENLGSQHTILDNSTSVSPPAYWRYHYHDHIDELTNEIMVTRNFTEELSMQPNTLPPFPYAAIWDKGDGFTTAGQYNWYFIKPGQTIPETVEYGAIQDQNGGGSGVCGAGALMAGNSSLGILAVGNQLPLLGTLLILIVALTVIVLVFGGGFFGGRSV